MLGKTSKIDAKGMIEILTSICGMQVNEIGKELGVDRGTVFNWSKKNTHTEEFAKLAKLKCADFDGELERISEAKRLIRDDEWSDLLRGILFDFKIRHEDLSQKLMVSTSVISMWTHGTTKPTLSHKLKMLAFLKNANKSVENLMVVGKEAVNSILIDKCLFDKRKSVKRSELSGGLFVAKDGRVFIDTPLLFPDSFHGNEMRFVFDGDRVVVFWENKNKAPFPLYLPRFIEVDDTLLTGIGIWVAEGTKTKRRPKVTNSEPMIVRQAIKFFEHIGIDKPKLCGWIQVHERSPLKYDDEKLAGFWSSETGLQRQQIRYVFVKDDRSTSPNKVPIKEFGTFHLECNFMLSRLLIDGFLSNVDKILESVPNSGLPMLKGIFCGEGWCGLAKTGSVNEITVTMKEKRWRSMIFVLLSGLGITCKEHTEDFDISVCGWKNFEKLCKLDIFEFHPKMKERLDGGLVSLIKNNVPFRNKEMILDALSLSDRPLRAKEISNKLNISEAAVRRHLRDLLVTNKIGKVSVNKAKVLFEPVN